jgi:predicted enzyme related to lactoylglutathione lyase
MSWKDGSARIAAAIHLLQASAGREPAAVPLALTALARRLGLRAAQRRHLEDEMALDLFAGIPVSDYAAALPWYERVFGARPSFLPNDTEAVWEVAEHRFIYIVQDPGRAGNALVLWFVDDLDDRVARIARQGIEPVSRETYDGGVTKVTYRDAEGNEISFGGSGPG